MMKVLSLFAFAPWLLGCTAFSTSTFLSHQDGQKNIRASSSSKLQESFIPGNQGMSEYLGGPPPPNAGPAGRGAMAAATTTGGPGPDVASLLWPVRNLWDKSKTIKVHGDTLRTCSLPEPINNIHMMLQSDGRPIISKFELWQGPDYTPWELEVYSEDGIERPVNVIIATPKRENAIAIRNIANMEFPFDACIKTDNSLGEFRKALGETGTTTLIQGGALRSYPLPEHVQSVQILLKTDGRHLKAKVELLQGPNNKKQVFDVYASDGSYRPLHIIVDTPGGGNMVRIINKYSMEYPILATVQPLTVKTEQDMSYDATIL
eukprot:scaffold5234_cov131-Cylindrotheca_fusiformis.AAC.10